MINKIILFSTTLAGLAKHDSWQGKSVTGEMRSRTQVLTLSAPGTERALERVGSRNGAGPGADSVGSRNGAGFGADSILKAEPLKLRARLSYSSSDSSVCQ